MTYVNFGKVTMKVISLFILTLLMHQYGFSEPLTLGRLFTTIDQRDYLDNLKNKKEIKHNNGDINTDANNQDNTERHDNTEITLSGIIIRSDGTEKIWINGKLISNNNSIDTMLDNNNSAIIHLDNSENNPDTKKLKVGQKWRPNSREILESYSNQ